MIQNRKIGCAKTDVDHADLLIGQLLIDDFAAVIHQAVQYAAQGLRQHSYLVNINFPGGLFAVVGMVGDRVMPGQDLIKALMVLFKEANGQPGYDIDGNIDGCIVF